MEIKIELISKQTIKPSSSPPQHSYQLSFLDQIAPPIFMPLIYFYPPGNTNDKLSAAQKSNHLKQSLSKTLSIFYPLAGRLVDGLHVDCTSAGVPYVEAEANCNIGNVIENPVPEDMSKFLPYKLHDVRDLGMAVQVTHFRCGGIAVGLLISHKIGDALSFFMVANAWGQVARGGGEDDVVRPKFEGAVIFPPRNVGGLRANTGIVKEDGVVVSRIFSFSACKISDLRERYSNGCLHPRPTRVEALSAFLWTRFVSATQTNHDPNKIYTVLHAINLRNRLEPPLSEHHFGNISRLAIASPTAGDGGFELLQKVREAIRGVNMEYVSALIQEKDNKHLNMLKERMDQADKGDLVSFNFTSLCRFPLYEADFGWGKPAWVGSAPLTYKNLVTFMDTAKGDGIEAWINLSKEDMEKFECDLEIQNFISKV